MLSKGVPLQSPRVTRSYHMKRLLLLSLLLTAACDVDLFDPLGSGSYEYDVRLPDNYGNSGTRKWPVLVFLHGAGGLSQGNDIASFAAVTDSFPMILVTPRTTYTWENDRLSNVLEEVQKKYRTDVNRVYVTGYSMGAHGAFDWTAANPSRIAAAVMIAGAGRTGEGCKIQSVASYFIHNRNDPVVPTSETERTVAELQACGANPRVRINEEPGFVGLHNAWSSAYRERDLYAWMLSKSK
jgi:predicted peptidase